MCMLHLGGLNSKIITKYNFFTGVTELGLYSNLTFSTKRNFHIAGMERQDQYLVHYWCVLGI